MVRKIKSELVDRDKMVDLFRDDYWDNAAVELDALLCTWERGEVLYADTVPLELAPQLIVLGMHALTEGHNLVDDLYALLDRCRNGTPAPHSFCTFHASIAVIKWLKGDALPYDPKLGPYLQSRVAGALEAWAL